MKRTFAVIAVLVAVLMGLALAGCGKKEAPNISSENVPDFSKVFVQDENAAKSYLADAFVVVDDIAYSSEDCAAACPSMDRETADEAGKKLDMPGEWALYDLSPSSATFRMFGVSVKTSNIAIVDSLNNAFGVNKAVAYTQAGEDGGLQRIMWIEMDNGMWFSADSSGAFFVNFTVWGPNAGQMNENILAQHKQDIEKGANDGISDIYIVE